MEQNVFYVTNDGHLAHHGILGMKWGIRRFQPYPKGQRVKGGKEVGEATKVQQRGTSLERSKARTARAKERAAIRKERAKVRTIREREKAALKAERLRGKQVREKAQNDRKELKAKMNFDKAAANEMLRASREAKRNSKKKDAPQSSMINQPGQPTQSASYASKKEQAIKSGKASDVLKYKGNMTNKELQDAVTRLNLEKQLSSYSSNETTRASQKIDDMFKTMKKADDWLNTGIKTYNTMKRVRSMIRGGSSGGSPAPASN